MYNNYIKGKIIMYFGSELSELTPYREVAKCALMKYNGLTKEQALAAVSTQSYKELESQCYAEASMKYAIEKIQEILGLGDFAAESFEGSILAKDKFEIDDDDRNEFERINKRWFQKVIKDEYEIVKILSAIHDGWVKDNAKKFNKEGRESKRYQHLPLELIGWNEAKVDLMFVEPILKAINVKLDMTALRKEYNRQVVQYYRNYEINSREDLVEHILNVGNSYRPLTEVNTTKDVSVAKEMADQVIERMPKLKSKAIIPEEKF